MFGDVIQTIRIGNYKQSLKYNKGTKGALSERPIWY